MFGIKEKVINQSATVREVNLEMIFKIDRIAALENKSRSEAIILMLSYSLSSHFEKYLEEKKKNLESAYNTILENSGERMAERFKKSCGLKKLENCIKKQNDKIKKITNKENHNSKNDIF